MDTARLRLFIMAPKTACRNHESKSLHKTPSVLSGWPAKTALFVSTGIISRLTKTELAEKRFSRETKSALFIPTQKVYYGLALKMGSFTMTF